MLRFSIRSWATAILVCSLSRWVAAATMGNNPAAGGGVDGWSAILTVNETDTYTNISGGAEIVTIDTFNVNIGAVRGRVTPFVVRVTGDNGFTIVAIGRTRVAVDDYTSTGVKAFAFADAAPVVTLEPGETLAAGYTDANSDGTGNGGSVVPFVDGGDEIWLTGGPVAGDAGRLVLDASPAVGASTYDTLSRQYAFNVAVTTAAAGPLAPVALELAALDLFPSLPVGSEAGSFRTTDPNPDDTHTISLVSNPGGVFAVDGHTVRTAAAPGPVGTVHAVRVRTTDQSGLSFEADFTFMVVAPQSPTGIACTAGRVIQGSAPGAVLGQLSTTDPNLADAHVYTLVAGAGDADNALFAIAGDGLRLAAGIPAGRSSLSLRLRSTDRSLLSTDAVFTLPVVVQNVRLNEFVATNDTGLKDEDGSAEDWIELFNPLDTAIDLTGWRLADQPDLSGGWVLPGRVLQPGGFLVIFASGKDRRPAVGRLHTDFRLDGSSGEFLALVRPDGTPADVYEAQPQFTDLAFGVEAGGAAVGYLTPTPEAANGPVFPHGLNEVTFSVPRGFYDAPQTLVLSATLPGSVIRYTVNGSKPSAANGQTYTTPLTITPDTAGSTRGTRRVRAIALHPGAAVTRIATHSYLFVDGVTTPAADGVVGQTNSNAVTQTTAIKNHAIYGPLMDDALRAVPTVVINNPPGLPAAGESEASVELIDSTGTEAGFQIDCGIQAVGGHSISSPKNNFRLYFRAEYNAPKLKYDVFKGHPYAGTHPPVASFDRLSLRSGSHDTFFWMAEPANPPMAGIKGDALYLRSVIMDDLHLAMGHVAPHGRFVQVIVNGAYHGLYHLREYPDEDFLGSYRPGGAEAYDFTNGANPGENGTPQWQATWAKVKAAAATSAAEAARWIDLPQLADYMVLNFWAGNRWDWNPNQNWMGGGPRLPDAGGWIFFSYDNDVIWNDPDANVTHPSNLNFQPQTALAPGGLFFTTPTNDKTLMDHADFRVLFRDRFYKACFHGGVLDPARVQAVLDFRSAQIRTAIVAETARWQPAAATSRPWDRDGEWQTELTRIRDSFVVGRCATVLAQIKARGWYPVDAPEFVQHGGAVPAGYQPTLTGPADAEIYATMDGSDPRLPGGAIHTGAILITAPPPPDFAVNGPVLIRARARRTGDGEWSALNEASFSLPNTVTADATNLVISEIHYHPDPAVPAPGNEEFVEFMNTGTSYVDLSGAYFTRGLDYVFPSATILAPGQRWVVTARQFLNGTALSNGGEDLTLVQPGGAIIVDFRFRDVPPWPHSPDGTGPSLVLIAPTAHPDPSNPVNWRASISAGGNPGGDDAVHLQAAPTADDDGDGFPNLVEYALGDNPVITETMTPQGFTLTLPRVPNADDAEITGEVSVALDIWIAADPAESTPSSLTFRIPAALAAEKQVFIRGRVRLR